MNRVLKIWSGQCLYISVHLFQLHFYVACDLAYFINVFLHAPFYRWKTNYFRRVFSLEMLISVCQSVSTSEVELAPFIAEALVTDFDSSLASCRIAEITYKCLYTTPVQN